MSSRRSGRVWSAGVVAELTERQGINRPLKALAGKVDDPPLPAGVMAFVDWAARYACEPPGEALALALRGLRAAPPPAGAAGLRHGRGPAPADAGPRAGAGGGCARTDAGRRPGQAAGVSAGVVKGLIDDGALAWIEQAREAPFVDPDPGLPGAELKPQPARRGRLARRDDRPGRVPGGPARRG